MCPRLPVSEKKRPSLVTWIFSRFPWLAERWAARHGAPGDGEEKVPWARLAGPLSRARVALVTTAGIHLKDQQPFDMEDKEGDPSYRVLPSRLPEDAWTITHDYYDSRDALEDVNIVLPLDRLHELAGAGAIGEVSPRHLSFMGHIDGPHVETLLRTTGPEVAGLLAEDGVDAVLLAPA